MYLSLHCIDITLVCLNLFPSFLQSCHRLHEDFQLCSSTAVMPISAQVPQMHIWSSYFKPASCHVHRNLEMQFIWRYCSGSFWPFQLFIYALVRYTDETCLLHGPCVHSILSIHISLFSEAGRPGFDAAQVYSRLTQCGSNPYPPTGRQRSHRLIYLVPIFYSTFLYNIPQL